MNTKTIKTNNIRIKNSFHSFDCIELSKNRISQLNWNRTFYLPEWRKFKFLFRIKRILRLWALLDIKRCNANHSIQTIYRRLLNFVFVWLRVSDLLFLKQLISKSMWRRYISFRCPLLFLVLSFRSLWAWKISLVPSMAVKNASNKVSIFDSNFKYWQRISVKLIKNILMKRKIYKQDPNIRHQKKSTVKPTN